MDKVIAPSVATNESDYTVPAVEVKTYESSHSITIGELVVYTTACLIAITLVYVIIILSRRSIASRHLKQLMATSVGNTTPLRHFIRNPGAIHIVNTNVDLEWDKDDLYLDPDKQRQYLEKFSSNT